MTIIDEIQSGHESAFTEIYHRYHKKLYYYFLKKSGSTESAKDLVQVTFIKLWRFRGTLSEEYGIDTQLFNMARTCFIDYLRKQASDRSKMIRYAHFDANEGNSFLSPDVSHFEISDYLNIAIRSLSKMRQNVFILSRIKGLSNKEIAERLSISIKTVEDHMTKAFRQIRSILS